MINKELLVKRYKVLTKWPGSSYDAGQIIEEDEAGSVLFVKIKSINLFGFPEMYPVLFEFIPWYKLRQLEDMPEYVQLRSDKLRDMEINTIYQVIKTGTFTPDEIENLDKSASIFWCKLYGDSRGDRRYNFSNFIPSTQADYLNQQK